MLYQAYQYLTKVEDICLQFPGELSPSEIQDLVRFKNSFALGIYNARNHSLSTNEEITAHKELKKMIWPPSTLSTPTDEYCINASAPTI